MPSIVDTVMSTDIYQPSPGRHPLLSRISRDPRRTLLHLARRSASAILRLSWRLEVTVVIDAEVFADDRADAVVLFEQYLLRSGTHLVAYVPSCGPTGWQDLASVSLTAVDEVTVDDDGNADINVPWSAAALITVGFTVAARDLDPDMYLDVEPDVPTNGAVRRPVTVIRTVTRTPVRRHR